MKFIPHEYQEHAIRYIEEHPVAAVLLSMGLGKTIITLTAIQHLKAEGKVGHVLIIAPCG